VSNGTSTETSKELPDIKVIDLGSACFDGRTMYPYIQSRFYRAPEVVLGVPYDNAIDMWSIGCIAAELFVGLPLFPGVSEHAQLARIMDMFQEYPPLWMLTSGISTSKMFDKRNLNQNKSTSTTAATTTAATTTAATSKLFQKNYNGENRGKTTPLSLSRSDSSTLNERWSTLKKPTDHIRQRGLKKGERVENPYVFKTPKEYQESSGRTKVDAYKTYFRYSSLEDIIMFYSMPKGINSADVQKIRCKRILLVDLLRRLLCVDPTKRMTAAQALQHPFLTGESMLCKVKVAATANNDVEKGSEQQQSSQQFSAKEIDVAVKQWSPPKDLTLIMRQRSHQKQIDACEEKEFGDLSPQENSGNSVSNNSSQTTGSKGTFKKSAPRRISTSSNSSTHSSASDFSSSLPNYATTTSPMSGMSHLLSGQWSPGTSFFSPSQHMIPPPLVLSVAAPPAPTAPAMNLYPPHIQGQQHQQQQHSPPFHSPIGSFSPPQTSQQQQHYQHHQNHSLDGVSYRALNIGSGRHNLSSQFWPQEQQQQLGGGGQYLSPGPPDAFPQSNNQGQHHQLYQHHHQQMLGNVGGSGGLFNQQQSQAAMMSTSMGSMGSGTSFLQRPLPVIRETSTESRGSDISSHNNNSLPEKSRRAQLAIGEIQGNTEKRMHVSGNSGGIGNVIGGINRLQIGGSGSGSYFENGMFDQVR
jgi:serine/threonine protein kinase